jgi:hypothetical protein
MRYMFLLLFIMCFAGTIGLAQDAEEQLSAFPADSDAFVQTDSTTHSLRAPDEVETTRAYQAEPLTIRRFDKDEWTKIVKGIKYNEEPVEARAEQQPIRPWSGAVLRAVAYTIIAGIVILLIYYVVRYVSVDKIQRTKIETGDFEKAVEDIETLDIGRLLEQAKRDGNYKLAVRLYYLDLLKKLNERGAIAWKKDKTNREYLAELFSGNFFFEDIRRLTLSYEAVWYGDHNLMADSFDRLATQFESIRSKIGQKV